MFLIKEKKSPQEGAEEVKDKGQTPLNKGRLICLTIEYFIILFWFVVFKCNQNELLCVEFQSHRTILQHFLYGSIPFQSAIKAILQPSSETLLIFANFILFFPSGILLSILADKKRAILWIFAVALGIEVLQLFTGWGGYDITDVIITFLGGVVGVLFLMKIEKKLSNQTINAISTILYFVCLLPTMLVFFNTIIHFPPIGVTTLF